MSARSRVDALLEAVRSGRRPDLARLASTGELPVPPEHLLRLQVVLADGDDEELAGTASAALADADPEPVLAVLAEQSSAELLGGLLRHLRTGELLAEVVRQPGLEAEAALQAAPELPPEALEALVLREDLLVESPGLVDALEQNPRLPSHLQRRLAEVREHLLAPERPPSKGARAEPRDAPREATEKEMEVAVKAAAQEPAAGELGEEQTGLTEQQIRSLSVAVRLRLARGASHELRTILLRDSNPSVALAVLEHNPLGGAEVEHLVHSRSVVPEILDAIAEDRRWRRKYSILSALVKNPRTPVGTAVRLVPQLVPRDLRALSKDRNVPDAVRSRAASLYRMRMR